MNSSSKLHGRIEFRLPTPKALQQLWFHGVFVQLGGFAQERRCITVEGIHTLQNLREKDIGIELDPDTKNALQSYYRREAVFPTKAKKPNNRAEQVQRRHWLKKDLGAIATW